MLSLGGGADIGGSESSDCASDETGEISAASAESGFATDNQNEPELLTSDNDNVIAIILLIARSHAAVLEIENKPVPDFRTSLGSLTPLPPHKKKS